MHGDAKHDIIIIGKGPAGLQAAIYVARSRLSMLVVGHGGGSLSKAAEVCNYFGFAEPASGAQILGAGERQARALGARIVESQAVGIAFVEGGFSVQLPGGDPLHARAVVIATGASRERPPVRGIEAYEGKGVSYCAVCDGFFYKGKRVGVLGHAEYAMHEAAELVAVGADVTIYTNGIAPSVASPSDTAPSGASPSDIAPSVAAPNSASPSGAAPCRVVQGRVAELYGEGGRFRGLRLESGELHGLDGLFVAYGIAGSADFAKKLGVETGKGGSITTDARQCTNVPGVFAAGDCTGAFRQIAVAVGQGAIAARSAIEYCGAAPPAT